MNSNVSVKKKQPNIDPWFESPKKSDQTSSAVLRVHSGGRRRSL